MIADLHANLSPEAAHCFDTRGPEIAERLSGAKAAANDAGVSIKALPTHLASDKMAAQIIGQLDILGDAMDRTAADRSRKRLRSGS